MVSLFLAILAHGEQSVTVHLPLDHPEDALLIKRYWKQEFGESLRTTEEFPPRWSATVTFPVTVAELECRLKKLRSDFLVDIRPLYQHPGLLDRNYESCTGPQAVLQVDVPVTMSEARRLLGSNPLLIHGLDQAAELAFVGKTDLIARVTYRFRPWLDENLKSVTSVEGEVSFVTPSWSEKQPRTVRFFVVEDSPWTQKRRPGISSGL